MFRFPDTLGTGRLLIAAMLSICILSCCGRQRTGNFVHPADGQLIAGVPVTIECDSGGADELIAVALRYTDRYPYRSVSFKVSVADSSGRTLWDTVTIDLNDERGRRLGHGLGGSYQIEKITKLFFPPDCCTVELEHVMADDTIEGIETIGILSRKR